LEEYYNDDRLSFIETCKYQVLCWDNNIDADWEKSLPEAQAFARAEQIRKELAIEVEKQQVVENNEPAKKKSTTARKKKASPKKKAPAKKAG